MALPQLPENQKSYAGVPEAVFVVRKLNICENLTYL